MQTVSAKRLAQKNNEERYVDQRLESLFQKFDSCRHNPIDRVWPIRFQFFNDQ